MAWIATAVIVGSTLYSTNRQKKAAKQAKRDAAEADKQARKAEVFAETEGKGQGQLGQIDLTLEDEIEDEDESKVIQL